jgi:hypothetical protein
MGPTIKFGLGPAKLGIGGGIDLPFFVGSFVGKMTVPEV